MATIVNARDVILQAAPTRVAGVTMSNLTLTQDQVEGLGLVIDGTKMVQLAATSQVFQIPKSGSTSPSSIVVTAIVRNLTNAPALTVVSGTFTTAPVLSSGTVTITPTNMTSDTATLRLTVTEDSKTYTDDLTIVKVREGTDSVNVFLTNEAATIAADSLGNIVSWSGASGTFKVFQGITDVSNVSTYALAPGGNPSGLTQSINATSGVYSVTGGWPIGTDSTTVTYRATFGTKTFDKIFTITRSKAGANGSNGTNGSNGQRGSRSFYVTLSGSTATFSDSLATTTASVDGGPVRNDTVTQSNSSQGFSQTKFWDGTVWTIVNAVVDGNLLVSGTVGAGKLAADSVDAVNVKANVLTGDKFVANAITAREMALTDFTNLIPNGNLATGDITGFYNAQSGTTAGVPTGWSVLINTASGSASYTACPTRYLLRALKTTTENTGVYCSQNWIDVLEGDELYMSARAAIVGGSTNYVTNTVRLIPYWLKRDGTIVQGTSYYWPNINTSWLYNSQNLVAPADTVGVKIRIFHNNASGNLGDILFTDIELRRKNGGNLIVDGAVTATKINVTSLSAITATIGTLRTATTGARTEIKDNLIEVYDSSNVLRVKLGVF